MEATEYAFPFDSEETEEGYDREYLADDFARYFRAFITSGIIADGGNIADSLQVVANSNMTTTLRKGNLIIDGYRYELTKDMTFQHKAADGVLDRIDRITITLDTAGREIHAILQEGEYSYNPVAPECRRNSEYMDYVVADVRIVAGSIKVTQANITDTRLSTELCGIAWPFWTLDTEPFFAQLDSFYKEFVSKSDTSYDQFRQMLQTLYQKFNTEVTEDVNTLKQDSQRKHNELLDILNELEVSGQQKYSDFKAEITAYIAALKTKGDADLAEVVQELLDFKNTNETDFTAWLERIKAIFTEDFDLGALQMQIDAFVERLEDTESMLFTGTAVAGIEAGDGEYLTDDVGNPLLADWPICESDEVRGELQTEIRSLRQQSEAKDGELQTEIRSLRQQSDERDNNLAGQIQRLNSLYNVVFQSVSKGKAKIASAFADIGVNMDADATFDAIAARISTLEDSPSKVSNVSFRPYAMSDNGVSVTVTFDTDSTIEYVDFVFGNLIVRNIESGYIIPADANGYSENFFFLSYSARGATNIYDGRFAEHYV